MENGTFRANLNHLNQHGYLLVEQALDSETVRLWARTLFDLYTMMVNIRSTTALVMWLSRSYWNCNPNDREIWWGTRVWLRI